MSVKLTDVVKTFNGDGSISVIEWIKKVELVAKLQKIEELATFIPLFLEGDAFAIFDQLTAEDKEDYEQIKAALVKAFSMSPFQAFEAFKSRRLKPDEAPDKFLADIRRLSSLFGVENDALLACQFISGMSPGVGCQLKALKEGSLDIHKLLECAKQLLHDRDADENPFPVGAAGKSVRTGGLKDMGKQRCTGCYRPGHVQQSCRITCFGCGRKGHVKRNCPNETGAANVGVNQNSGNDKGETSLDLVESDVSPYPMGYQ